MHKKTDNPHDLSYSFPLSTQRFLERPRGEGGDAKRRGVRTRESNHLLSKTNLFLDTLSPLPLCNLFGYNEKDTFVPNRRENDHGYHTPPSFDATNNLDNTTSLRRPNTDRLHSPRQHLQPRRPQPRQQRSLRPKINFLLILGRALSTNFLGWIETLTDGSAAKSLPQANPPLNASAKMGAHKTAPNKAYFAP